MNPIQTLKHAMDTYIRIGELQKLEAESRSNYDMLRYKESKERSMREFNDTIQKIKPFDIA